MFKDPAFLMYSKDWIEGTADMMPDEKGVFIDLLCHQHQKGKIPSDTVRLARLVGLPQDRFLTIWEHLKHKFISTGNGCLVNQKLINVVTERTEFSLVKKIAGEFSQLLRESGFQDDKKTRIKQQFKTKDYLKLDPNEVKGKIKSWMSKF